MTSLLDQWDAEIEADSGAEDEEKKSVLDQWDNLLEQEDSQEEIDQKSILGKVGFVEKKMYQGAGQGVANIMEGVAAGHEAKGYSEEAIKHMVDHPETLSPSTWGKVNKKLKAKGIDRFDPESKGYVQQALWEVLQEQSKKVIKSAREIADAYPEVDKRKAFKGGLLGMAEDAAVGMSEYAPSMALYTFGAPAIALQEKGRKYKELKEKGIDAKTADMASDLHALTAAPIEYAGNLLQLKMAGKAITAIAKKTGVSKRIVDLVKTVAKSASGPLVTSMLGEGAEEGMQAVAEVVADVFAENPNASWEEIRGLAWEVYNSPEFIDHLKKSVSTGMVGGGLIPGAAIATATPFKTAQWLERNHAKKVGKAAKNIEDQVMGKIEVEEEGQKKDPNNLSSWAGDEVAEQTPGDEGDRQGVPEKVDSRGSQEVKPDIKLLKDPAIWMGAGEQPKLLGLPDKYTIEIPETGHVPEQPKRLNAPSQPKMLTAPSEPIMIGNREVPLQIAAPKNPIIEVGETGPIYIPETGSVEQQKQLPAGRGIAGLLEDSKSKPILQPEKHPIYVSETGTFNAAMSEKVKVDFQKKQREEAAIKKEREQQIAAAKKKRADEEHKVQQLKEQELLRQKQEQARVKAEAKQADDMQFNRAMLSYETALDEIGARVKAQEHTTSPEGKSIVKVLTDARKALVVEEDNKKRLVSLQDDLKQLGDGSFLFGDKFTKIAQALYNMLETQKISLIKAEMQKAREKLTSIQGSDSDVVYANPVSGKGWAGTPAGQAKKKTTQKAKKVEPVVEYKPKPEKKKEVLPKQTTVKKEATPQTREEHEFNTRLKEISTSLKSESLSPKKKLALQREAVMLTREKKKLQLKQYKPKVVEKVEKKVVKEIKKPEKGKAPTASKEWLASQAQKREKPHLPEHPVGLKEGDQVTYQLFANSEAMKGTVYSVSDDKIVVHKTADDRTYRVNSDGIIKYKRSLTVGDINKTLVKVKLHFGKKIPFKVMQSTRDLKGKNDRLYDQITKDKAHGDVQGLYDPQTGTIYIFTESNSDVNELKRTIWHELSHYSLKDLLGNKCNPLLDRVRSKYSTDISNRIRYFGYEDTVENRNREAEELIVDLSMSGADTTLKQKLIDAFKVLARKLGFDVAITDSEIVKLLKAIQQNLLDGKSDKKLAKQIQQLPLKGSKVKEQLEARYYRTKYEPKKDKHGNYLGAPSWVNEATNKPAALRQLRKLVTNLFEEGKAARYWYEESTDEILKYVGNDIQDAEKFIGLVALYSQNTQPWTNMIQAVKAWNQYKYGVSKEDFQVGLPDKKAIDILYNRIPYWKGRKVGSFYENLMAEILNRFSEEEISKLKIDTSELQSLQNPVTADMWMYRAFGYHSEGTTADKGSGQYTFVENEVKRLTELHNRNLKPGEEPWTPHQIQAAIWEATRQRYNLPEVIAKTKEESVAKGFSKYNEKGIWAKPTKVVPLKEHKKLWRKHALAVPNYEVKNYESFKDVLREMTQVITWEAKPSESLNYEINDAPDNVVIDFTDKARKILLDKTGKDLLAEQLDIPLLTSKTSSGGYDGSTTPNVLTHILPLKIKGEVGQFYKDKVNSYCKAIQYIYKQDAVPWFRADTKIKKGSEGYRITFDLPLTKKLEQRFFTNLQLYIGDDSGYTKLGKNQIAVINYSEKSDADFEKDINRLETQIGADLGIIDVERFKAEGEYGYVHNWERDKEGKEIILQDDTLGRSSVQSWLHDRRSDFDKLIKEYSGEKLRQKSLASQRSQGIVYQRLSKPPVQNGKIELSHWSNRDDLNAIDPSFYGTAMAGAEKKRKASDPANWVNRAYYGIAVGQPGGYEKEPGLGSYQYETAIPEDELYDFTSDPEGLISQAREAAASNPFNNIFSVYEKLIAENGYKGYWTNHETLGLTAAMFEPVTATKKFETTNADVNSDLEKTKESLAKYSRRKYNESNKGYGRRMQAEIYKAQSERKPRPKFKANWISDMMREAEEDRIAKGEKPKYSRGTDTPEFIKWFGKSVITENGEPGGQPKVVYHGTDIPFATFDKTKPEHSFGFHFGNKAVANQFAIGKQYSKWGDRFGLKPKEGGNIIPVYLNIEHPLYLTDYGTWNGEDTVRELVEKNVLSQREGENILSESDLKQRNILIEKAIKEFGRDGIIYTNQYESKGSKSYIVFDSTQVKSIFNKGSWSKDNPDITYNRKTKYNTDNLIGPKKVDAVNRLNLSIAEKIRIRTAEGKYAMKKLEGGDIDGAISGFKSMSMLHSFPQIFNIFMEHGVPEFKDNWIEMHPTKEGGLNKVIKDLGDTQHDFFKFMTALSAKELLDKNDSEIKAAQKKIEELYPYLKEVKKTAGPRDLSEIKKMEKELKELRKTVKGRFGKDRNLFGRDELGEMIDDRQFIADLLEDTAQTYRQNKKLWDKAEQRLREINTAVLDFAEKASIIADETRQDWERTNYIPFYRVVEDFATGEIESIAPRTAGQNVEGIKHLKGTKGHSIGNPFANLVNAYSFMLNNSLLNLARLKSLKLAHEADLLTEVKTKEPGAVSIRANGKQKWFKVDDPWLYDAVTDIHAHTEVPWILRAPKRLLTWGVTLTPAFRFANAFRDTLHTFFIGNHFKPIIDSVIGGYHAWKETPEFIEFASTGGAFSGSFAAHEVRGKTEKEVDKLIKRSQGDRAWWKKLYDAWEKVGEASENAARMGLYLNLKKEGKSNIDASFEARDLLDFHKKGNAHWMQYLIGSIPFLNARIQGLMKLGRNAWDVKTRKRMWLRGSVAIAASFMYGLTMGDDDDYENLPDYKKRTYLNLPGGIQLPIPFEVGSMFIALPAAFGEYIKQKATGKGRTGKEMWEILYKTVLETLSFNPIPQTLKPGVEVIANWDSFRGTDITPKYEEKLNADLRVTPKTYKLFKLLAEKFDLPPKKAQHFLRGMFGTMFDVSMDMVDIAAEHWNGNDPAGTNLDRYLEIVGVKRFYKGTEEPSYTRAQERFYDMKVEFDKALSSYNQYKKTKQKDKARALRSEKRPQMKMSKKFGQYQEKISKRNQKMKLIHLSEKLTLKEKKEKLDYYLTKRNEIFKKAVAKARHNEVY